MLRTTLFVLGLAGIFSLRAAAEPVGEACEALRQVVREESTWVKVHGAEVLLAAGDNQLVAEVFKQEEQLHGQEKNYRVGIWRVLAQACPGERKQWWGRIAATFLDTSAPDRLFALESLAKLGDPLPPEVTAAVQAWAASAPIDERAFADWLDAQRREGRATARLVEGLRSTEVLARYRSAYVLRRLRCTDSVTLAALAAAAAAEPADSIARPTVIGAAYALTADPAQMARWAATLEQMVQQGAPAAYDALQALPAHYMAADLPRLQALLKYPQADVRTGAAWAILRITGQISTQ